MRKIFAAPRLTATRRMTPSNIGCNSGLARKPSAELASMTRKQKVMARNTATPKIVPIAPPVPAKHRRAADDDGGDGIERVGSRLDRIGVAASRLHREIEPGETGEEPAHDVSGKLGAIDADAGHVGRALVRADGVGGAADLGIAIGQPEGDDHDNQYDDRHWNLADQIEPCRRLAIPPAEGRRQFAEGVGRDPGEIAVDFAAGGRAHEQSEAAVDRSGRERHHDRLQAAVDDDQTVDEAAEKSDRDTERDPEHDLRRRAAHDLGGDRIHQRHQRADGEVDAAEKNGESLAHAQQHEGQSFVRILHEEVDGEALGVKGAVKKIERKKQGEREQRAGIPRNEVVQTLHVGCSGATARSSIGRLNALATIAVSVIAEPTSSRTIRPE